MNQTPKKGMAGKGIIQVKLRQLMKRNKPEIGKYYDSLNKERNLKLKRMINEFLPEMEWKKVS